MMPVQSTLCTELVAIAQPAPIPYRVPEHDGRIWAHAPAAFDATSTQYLSTACQHLHEQRIERTAADFVV
jgi:hypothetical protein